MEREQGKDNHQPPEELGTASIVSYVWKHKVTQFGKVRTAGQTSYLTPGNKDGEEFLQFVSFQHSLENIKHLCHGSILVLIYLRHLWRKPQTRKKLP